MCTSISYNLVIGVEFFSYICARSLLRMLYNAFDTADTSRLELCSVTKNSEGKLNNPIACSAMLIKQLTKDHKKGVYKRNDDHGYKHSYVLMLIPKINRVRMSTTRWKNCRRMNRILLSNKRK